MRVIFAGTPDFAAHSLEVIEAAGHTIALVLTQPDRRAGRGMHLQASPVKEFALGKGIPLLQPASLNTNSLDEAKRTEAIAALSVIGQTQFDAITTSSFFIHGLGSRFGKLQCASRLFGLNPLRCRCTFTAWLLYLQYLQCAVLAPHYKAIFAFTYDRSGVMASLVLIF